MKKTAAGWVGGVEHSKCTVDITIFTSTSPSSTELIKGLILNLSGLGHAMSTNFKPFLENLLTGHTGQTGKTWTRNVKKMKL